MENYSLFTIHFIEAWLLYLVMQALFINAIKLGAAGDTATMPDGSVRDSEMILYPLAKELLKKEPVKIYYKEDALEDWLSKLLKSTNVGAFLEKAYVFNGDTIVLTSDENAEKLTTWIAWLNNNELYRNNHFELTGLDLNIYTYLDQFVYSKWLRKPIIQCIVCMSSFWGLFTFLVPMLIVNHFNLWVFPAYLVNTALLSVVNKLVFKLLQ